MDTQDTVRQATAAEMTGIDKGQLSRMIQSGSVKTVETADGLKLVPLAEVERLKVEDRKPGRPKKAD